MKGASGVRGASKHPSEAWPAVCPDTRQFVPAGPPTLRGMRSPRSVQRPGLRLGSRCPPRRAEAPSGLLRLCHLCRVSVRTKRGEPPQQRWDPEGGPVTATQLLDVKPPSAQHRAVWVAGQPTSGRRIRGLFPGVWGQDTLVHTLLISETTNWGMKTNPENRRRISLVY